MIPGITPESAPSEMRVSRSQEGEAGNGISETPSGRVEHIAVCVCTCRRPELLRRLLKNLLAQETHGLFTCSLVIVDNDDRQSASPVVSELANGSPIPMHYCVEPQQGIGRARNTAVANAEGDFIAFIDDDEFPARNWLLLLFKSCNRHQVDGVLGPVLRHFDQQPPAWLLKSRFYTRKIHRTGTRVAGKEGRTGNVLLKRKLFAGDELPFNPELHRGEDTDFFLRMTSRGHTFIWCDDALVYETVPPSRWSRRFILKRALVRAGIHVNHREFGAKNLLKSAIAVPLYGLALPFTLLLGQHRFWGLLERLVAHLGELLALVGLKLVRNSCATE